MYLLKANDSSAAASRKKGPLLFVNAIGTINSETAVELSRLRPDHIVVLGSDNAISGSVMTALSKYAPARQTSRLSGNSAFATAAAISAATFPASCGCTVYVAQPTDILEASTLPAAASSHPGPVLFANSTGSLDASTKTEA